MNQDGKVELAEVAVVAALLIAIVLVVWAVMADAIR